MKTIKPKRRGGKRSIGAHGTDKGVGHHAVQAHKPKPPKPPKKPHEPREG